MVHALRPHLARFVLPLSLAASAVGCSFEAASDGAALTSNTCSTDVDCGPSARCDGAMCVARNVESSLRVVLEVMPAEATDGVLPVPFAIDDLTVDRGRMFRNWTVSPPVRVTGRVRNDSSIVEADVTLTAIERISGLLPRVVVASVARSTDMSAAHDFDVRVAKAGEYTLRVQPKDTTLPPLERVVMVEEGAELDIDYADPDDVEIYTLELEIDGATDDRPLVVRAFDARTGALISSTGLVTMQEATLRFAGKPDAYRVVVRPEGAYDPEGSSSGDNCDRDTPVLPTLSIDSSAMDIEGDGERGTARLVLPTVPERIAYRGSIELCDAPSTADTAPASLSLTLRSKTVALEDGIGEWMAEVAADTEASLIDGRYAFCVDIFQGTYDVVVTPPASQPCEILAEARTVSSQDGEPATSALLSMSNAAELAGEVQTHDMMALASATVDVHSLGRDNAVELEANFATLTGYNRSRQTTTDASGAFSLAVDRGSYDVTFKPPPGSGYGWYVLRDVTIGSQMRFTNTIDMSSPVAVDCSIKYERGDFSLAGAEITAYAIVSDARRVERAIAIGKALADESGAFMLLLPSAVHEGW